jgi:two-component system, NtrC family, response regulator AtoC
METNKIEVEALMDRGFVCGMSPAIRALESVIAEIARTDIPVLLVGESGTGKEMFARRVHSLSHHSREPLMRIACASTSATTLTNELGLNSTRNGDGLEREAGTVFFDEIS